MNSPLEEAISHLCILAEFNPATDSKQLWGNYDRDQVRKVLEALMTRDGAKACTEHVWAFVGEPPHAAATPPSALETVAAELNRVANVEGFDASHDDQHVNDELARAAACYALDPVARMYPTGQGSFRRSIWPFEESWWKPTPEDREKELVKAAALCVAEIVRLRRLKSSSR